MHYATLVEKGCCFVKLSTVSNANAEVIEPYAVRAKMIVGDGLARIPWRRNTQQ